MAIKHSILLDWRQQLSDTHAKPVKILLKSNRSYIVAKGASFEMVVLQQKLVFLHSHFLLQHPYYLRYGHSTCHMTIDPDESYHLYLLDCLNILVAPVLNVAPEKWRLVHMNVNFLVRSEARCTPCTLIQEC
ncbi:hypothetical protein RRG08_031277 [Elysia crispata]|uniref:Uncharacterized protein n=1 Tax=Elysia crispata TaxID=231223 RepID=A0AAE1AK68_9GAST|nr:hypothetical protein RRG08_031277 [Elysia crispata]